MILNHVIPIFQPLKSIYMTKKRQFLGYSLKEESVEVLNQNILQKTFVIDVHFPFAGYHGHGGIYDPSHPRAVLFMTKERQPFENVLRTTDKLNQIFDFDLIAGPCEVTIWNKKIPGIRVKGIPTYQDILHVQHAFRDEGYAMRRSNKIKNATVLIKVKKFFNVEYLDDGICKDLDDPLMSYIEVPEKFNWELFRKKTTLIKNNVNDHNYDIVEGIFYKDGQVQDMLRVIKPNISLELLQKLKEEYNGKVRQAY